MFATSPYLVDFEVRRRFGEPQVLTAYYASLASAVLNRVTLLTSHHMGHRWERHTAR